MIDRQTVEQELVQYLEQVADRRLSSQILAEWSDNLYWDLMEGTGKDLDKSAINELREILYDIVIQWECLQGNTRMSLLEIPKELLDEWLAKVKQLSNLHLEIS